MGARRWQVPAAVAASAATASASTVAEAERFRDLAGRVPVALSTLDAVIASHTSPIPIVDWATRVSNGERAAEASHTASALAAADCDEAYGILDPGWDFGERVVAVVRAGALGLERWGPSGWGDVDIEPDGFPYVVLTASTLADALEAIGSGGSLILSPSRPTAFARESPLVAAADAVTPSTDLQGARVFAVTDPLDTTAVVTLFEVAIDPASHKPDVKIRKGGAWADGSTLLAQLQSLAPPPVIAITPDQLQAVIRQVDDFDATHPQTANHPTGGLTNKAVAASADNHDNDVMIALPVDPELAGKLRADGATEDADSLHVTLAYLGDKNELPVGREQLEGAVRNWAAKHPPMSGVISGPAVFSAGQSPVVVALPDLPGLPDARQHLVHQLRAAGASPNEDHGFTPHITLSYLDSHHPDEDDIPRVQNHPVHFSKVGLYYGTDRVDVPLSGSPSEEALAASSDVADAVTLDKEWEASRAGEDHAEQVRRHEFETRLGRRHSELTSEGHDVNAAATVVRREMQAEDDRRQLWERDRVESVAAEKARRLACQAQLQAMRADAAPHTMMPPALVKYWIAGPGAAKVRWNTAGDWSRAVRHLAKYMDLYRAKAAANELHKLATGRWTGSRANKLVEGGKVSAK